MNYKLLSEREEMIYQREYSNIKELELLKLTIARRSKIDLREDYPHYSILLLESLSSNKVPIVLTSASSSSKLGSDT